ncbi:MAG: hypothetical protein HKL84_01885, partial [Acidimicrobiaceae bacterium]|nr:hypothetical protein [Acidimicrobiaceae bacterium]
PAAVAAVTLPAAAVVTLQAVEVTLPAAAVEVTLQVAAAAVTLPAALAILGNHPFSLWCNPRPVHLRRLLAVALQLRLRQAVPLLVVKP